MTQPIVGFYDDSKRGTFNPKGLVGANTAYSTLLSASNMNLLWKSYIFNTTNASVATPTTTAGVWQVAITAQIYLKHLHSFFERVCLLKGVFMNISMNLNQTSISFTSPGVGQALTNMVVNSPLGGVSPLMLASTTQANAGGVACFVAGNYIASLSVGATCLNNTQTSLGAVVQSSPLGRNILLNVPSYICHQCLKCRTFLLLLKKMYIPIFTSTKL